MNRTTIFDAIRKLFGPLKQEQVEVLDSAIDDMVTGVPSKPSLTNKPYRAASTRGIALIHRFEGYARKLPNGDCQAYPDPGSGGAPWTIGWGSTTDEYGNPIKPGTVWTQERANTRFARHLEQFESEVTAILGNTPTTQNQYDALVSFAYNLGSDKLRGSTLMRKHKMGDYAGAAQEFHRWTRASGRVLQGLVRRRKAEADLYSEA
jgi:lysozyme